MHLRAGVVLTAAVMAAGCGRYPETPGLDRSLELPASLNARVGDQSGLVTASYEDATSTEAIRGRELMKNAHMLEAIANDINDTLKLPTDIALVGAQCDQPNAFWSNADKRITICYEDADLSLRLFTDSPPDNVRLDRRRGESRATDIADAAVNAEVATAYHELGHAVIDLYDLPVTGREEDVADQLAAYLILEPNEVLEEFPNAARVAEDYAIMFQEYAKLSPGLSESDLAATHSANAARKYNLVCWVYGSDPITHAGLVANVGLPESRANGCPAEYQQLVKAWSTLLDPHMKSPSG